MFKNLIRLLLIKVIELNLFLRERLLFVAPKEQPPRKLSGKRTVQIKFWKETSSHRRSKSLRYQYRWGKIGTI